MEIDDENTEAPPQEKVHTYVSEKTIYALGFSNRRDQPFRLAVCSFSEDNNNINEVVQLSGESNNFERLIRFETEFPANKVLWIPDEACNYTDILATSGENIKIWQVRENSSCELKSNLTTDSVFNLPLTSFDWNVEAVNLVCTSSIDTTCTIWDLEQKSIVKQMIAHEDEVYDISFSAERDIFASVSGDGSLRQFDLRNLKHSTLLYESRDMSPIIKLAWNRKNKNLIALIENEKDYITLVDCRNTSKACSELKHHKDFVNAVCWAPHSSTHICSVGDDKHALIWDLTNFKPVFDQPLLYYNADYAIANLCWSQLQKDWLSICYTEFLQILKV